MRKIDRLLDAYKDRCKEGGPLSFDEFVVIAAEELDGVSLDELRAGIESCRSPLDVSVRYQIQRFHARGGLGEVFIAHDHLMNRDVAIKTVRNHAKDNASVVQRFQREVVITALLEHPGIVPVYAMGPLPDGRPAFVMRFLSGETLNVAVHRFHDCPTLPARHPQRLLDFHQLVRHFLDVCNTMAFAHSKNVIHRDLKPSNILLGKFGETWVVDWGLARMMKAGMEDDKESEAGSGEIRLEFENRSGEETQMGTIVGTPCYMSPEQARGRIDLLSPASDIYALGAVLYAILAGRPAIVAESKAETLARVIAGDYAPPRSHKPGAPKILESICLRAMATEPANRYPTVAELRDDIERWLASDNRLVDPQGNWFANWWSSFSAAANDAVSPR